MFAGYLAYMIVGWFLNALGSVLPDLEEAIGRRASLYSLLPGIVLLAWGSVIVRRHRDAEPANPHHSTLSIGSISLVAGVLTMGVTRWFAVSFAGAMIAAVAAATLIRLMPALLAAARPDDTALVMMRANAWSSIAGIAGPLAVGASIGLGAGWLPGMALPMVAAATVIVVIARATQPAEPGREPHITIQRHLAQHDPVVPPVRMWWREWTMLTLCIVVEFCFAYFAATFLHEEVGLSTAASAAGASAWAIGMAVGRFAVSTWPPPRSIVPSIALIAVGFGLLWGIASPVSSIAGIGIAGLGASPMYPSRMTALLDRFPRSPDQASTRGAIASGAALLGAPALMTGLRALSDVRTAYLAVPVLLVALTILGTRSAQPQPSSLAVAA